jgi:hypothetical protein
MSHHSKEYFKDENGDIVTHKTCLKCRERKELCEFTKSRSGKYKVHNFCKDCLKIYNRAKYEENKDKMIKNAQNWAAENPEKAALFKEKYLKKKNPNHEMKVIIPPPYEPPDF